MAILKRYWNRVGHIEVTFADGDVRNYSGLDFTFKVKKIGSIYVEFDCGILGLNMESINRLTTLGPNEARDAMTQIKVFAGYEDEGEVEIARGYVLYAKPTNPPEMWMNFHCLKYLGRRIIGKYDEKDFSTTKKAFAEIAKMLELNPVWKSRQADRPISHFDIGGKIVEKAAYDFGQKFGLVVYEDDGSLIARDKVNPELGNTRTISMEEGGLLSIGNIDIFGGDITTRLDDSIKLFDKIRLEPRFIPKATAEYYPIEKQLVGHFRGNEWFTKYRLVRNRI